MQKKVSKYSSKLATIVRSRWFFVIVLAFFVFESAWIAISSRYPMAFDEDTHLGIIKIFARQWSPLLLHQPPGPAPFSTLVRDPSYLYYWIMSWPYRWLNSVCNFQTTIIVLRFINVAFFASGLVLFRKVLLKTRASAAVVNIALLFFALIPTAPLLAGQINYDNLFFLLLAWNLLLLLQFRERLLAKKVLNVSLLLGILALGMLASLVLFSYLPIFAAIVIYVVFLLLRSQKSWQKLLQNICKNWRTTRNVKKYSALIVLVVSLGLFVEMYGTNLVVYHDITPQCGQILDVERCMASGPWARNYNYSQHPVVISDNPIIYTGGWLMGMAQRTFFVINGPTGPESYANSAPLPLMTFSALLVFAFGIVLVVRYWRQVLAADPVLSILLCIMLAYVVALWGKLYYDYAHLGRLVAINGRYLLLVILPILVAIGKAYWLFLAGRWRNWLAAILFLLFLQGGGFLSFIYFSDANWYWPHDQFVLRINHDAQAFVRPLTINWPKDIKW